MILDDSPGSLSALFEDMAGLTVWEAFARSARQRAVKVAVVDGERRVTFEELLRQTAVISEKLAALGLERGDVAAIYMRNSVELIETFYALQRLGICVAWLNPDYREQELRHILTDSGARAVFCFEEWEGFRHLDLVVSLRDELPQLEWVLAVSVGEGRVASDVIPFDRLLAGRRPPNSRVGEDVTPEDRSMLLYTSGTTGRPKGAVSEQWQVLRGGMAYSQGVAATGDDVFIAVLCMSHSYGCGSLLVQAITLGATLVLLPRFSGDSALRLIERERVTLQIGSPAHYLLELQASRTGNYDLSSLRAGFISGQMAPPGLVTEVERHMGVYVSSVLGASEVGPGLSVMLPYGSSLEMRERYVGYPIEGTQARVLDAATGAEAEPGEPGELLLAGWHLMQGYWNDTEATEHQMSEGWLRTGDLVVREANGLIRILGRLKDCINRGGFKVIPSELERLLFEHPSIEEVCVVATPNPVLGESICVCAIPRGSDSPSLDGLCRFLKGRVADNKLPDELLVLETFPRLSGGLKVNRYGSGGLAEVARDAIHKQTTRAGGVIRHASTEQAEESK